MGLVDKLDSYKSLVFADAFDTHRLNNVDCPDIDCAVVTISLADPVSRPVFPSERVYG